MCALGDPHGPSTPYMVVVVRAGGTAGVLRGRGPRGLLQAASMASTKITLEEVQKVARLARLSLSQTEAQGLQHDLDAILGYVALLEEVDTSGVEPTAHAIAGASTLRADVIIPSLAQNEALAAAPAARDGGFSVPKVLEVES